MSYILDALRKADAQRERDPTRGIHAQPLRAAMGEGGRTVAYRSWAWIAGAIGLASLAAVGWYVFRDKGAPAPVQREATIAQAARPPVIQAPAMQPPPATQVLPPPAPVLPPPPQQSIKPPPTLSMEPPRGIVSARAAAQGARPAPLPNPGTATAQVDAAPASAPEPPPSGPGMAPAPGPGMQPIAPPAPARQGMPAAPMAIPPAPPTAPVAGLPPDAPKLTITGGVYSTNRSQRMLIVNGQVFREGADLGSGVTLEEIRPKSVYLRFRGARYSAAMP